MQIKIFIILFDQDCPEAVVYGWAYSVPPGYNRVEVEAKTWWGPVTMPTGAPVESRFKKDHNFANSYTYICQPVFRFTT